MNKLFIMAALVIALVFAGCDKDGGDGGDTPSNTTKLKARNESSVALADVKQIISARSPLSARLFPA
jgi:hypothetical protein